MTLRIGFLGTGFISRTHSYFLKHSTVDHRIVSVHDVDTDRAAAFADRVGAEVAVDAERVLDTVDAVFVTTWTSEHERLVAAAAERGVAVLCEKPLAVDGAGARRIVDSVESAGVANQVGLVLRFLPQFVRALQLLADERAGQLMAVSFRDDQFIPIQSYYGSTWRIDPTRCGRGTLLEHSIHDVDVLQWLAGPVDAVSGTTREFHGHPRIDDVASARLEFAGGAVADLLSIWHDMTDRPSQRHIECFSEHLYLRLDGTPNGSMFWQFAGEPMVEMAGRALLDDAVEAGLPAASPFLPDDVLDLGDGAMFNPVTPFLRSLRDGSASPLPLRAALPAHDLVDAIYTSADQGGTPVRTTA